MSDNHKIATEAFQHSAQCNFEDAFGVFERLNDKLSDWGLNGCQGLVVKNAKDAVVGNGLQSAGAEMASVSVKFLLNAHLVDNRIITPNMGHDACIHRYQGTLVDISLERRVDRYKGIPLVEFTAHEDVAADVLFIAESDYYNVNRFKLAYDQLHVEERFLMRGEEADLFRYIASKLTTYGSQDLQDRLSSAMLSDSGLRPSIPSGP